MVENGLGWTGRHDNAVTMVSPWCECPLLMPALMPPGSDAGIDSALMPALMCVTPWPKCSPARPYRQFWQFWQFWQFCEF
jgi:hypothetical protein